MKILLFVSIIFWFIVSSFAQSAKINPIIIDSDCAADDLRTVCQFMAISEIEVLAITSSEGALSPQAGIEKINNLLQYLKQSEIPTGQGRQLSYPSPPWRVMSENIVWGLETTDKLSTVNAVDLIIKQLKNSQERVTIICLGSLTNVYDAIKLSPEIKKKIKKIIWYVNSIKPLSGINYRTDTISANYIMNSGLVVDAISNLKYDNAVFDEIMLQKIDSIKTMFASAISISHNKLFLNDSVQTGHMKLWDDLIAVYFLYPELFDMKPLINSPNHSINIAYKVEVVRDMILKILAQQYNIDKCITFEKFPDALSLYRYDVQQIVTSTRKKYGNEEWKCCVLTNEIHRHLGIYSIVGAKMGIKAREIFNAGLDRLKVQSYAGNRPPISCLNDGIQVSTGATLGLGAISIISDTIPLPEATFEFKGKKIHFKLKEKYKKQVASDIENGIINYGMLTSGYWKIIRKLSIQYWADWDRDEIFEITNLK